jgi:hypothetical protein
MKPIRIKLLIVALAALALLATWWGFSPKTNGPLADAAETRGSETKSDANTMANAPNPVAPLRPRTFESQQRTVIAAMNAPIDFYGRVLDQHGNPVPDADVKLFANDNWGERSSQYARKTDEDGRFFLEGAKGLALGVEVSKPGFRVVPWSAGKPSSTGTFEYGLSSRGPHQSSRDAPTIFVLYKPGPIEPLIKMGEKNFRIARDGSPLSISTDKQDGHQVILRCWNQDRQRPAGQRRYDWRLEISVPKGGLVARKDAFAFEAPESGYLASDTVEMPALLQDQWRSFAERYYFIRFDDGTFARVNLRMRAGGDHFVVWESHWNPSPNSRNLESDPKLDQERR